MDKVLTKFPDNEEEFVVRIKDPKKPESETSGTRPKMVWRAGSRGGCWEASSYYKTKPSQKILF